MAVRTYSFQLYRPRPTDNLATNRKILRDDMKLCSRVAAFQGKQVILLVHQDLGADCLLDASIFMNEGKCWTVILTNSQTELGSNLESSCDLTFQGTCADLYTDDEVRKLATMMTPGQVKLTKLDKIDASFKKFTERVRQNMHVIICLNMISK